jgi:hypothetical protein
MLRREEGKTRLPKGGHFMLKLEISNFSSAAWTRTDWICAAGSSGSEGAFDKVINTPATSLEANDGQTTAEAESEYFTWLVQDCLYIQVAYGNVNAHPGVRRFQFAVKVSNSFQMFGIGSGTEWAYSKNGKWTSMGSDSTPVTLDLDLFEVLMTPTLQSQDGSVEVIIKNKKK